MSSPNETVQCLLNLENPPGGFFLNSDYDQPLSVEERNLRAFSQFEKLPWPILTYEELEHFSTDLNYRMSELDIEHLPMGLGILCNLNSGDYLIQDLFHRPTYLDQELVQARRGFVRYKSRLVWDRKKSETVSWFGADYRWERAVRRQASLARECDSPG